MVKSRNILWLLAIGAIAVGAWTVVHRLPFASPDRASQTTGQLELTHSPVVLSEIGVRSDTSVTTPDGTFTIKVHRVSADTVRLTVSAKAGDIYRFNKAKIGHRLVVPAPDGTYYVDILRIRNNVVYLTMGKLG